MAGNPRRPTPERVAELAAQGLTDRQIADLHGVTRGTIEMMRRRNRIATAVDYPRQKGAEQPIVVATDPETGWLMALAGRRYTDQPGTAAPVGILRNRPPPQRHNGSSMAYA